LSLFERLGVGLEHTVALGSVCGAGIGVAESGGFGAIDVHVVGKSKVRAKEADKEGAGRTEEKNLYSL